MKKKYEIQNKKLEIKNWTRRQINLFCPEISGALDT